MLWLAHIHRFWMLVVKFSTNEQPAWVNCQVAIGLKKKLLPLEIKQLSRYKLISSERLENNPFSFHKSTYGI